MSAGSIRHRAAAMTKGAELSRRIARHDSMRRASPSLIASHRDDRSPREGGESIDGGGVIVDMSSGLAAARACLSRELDASERAHFFDGAVGEYRD